MAYVLIAGWAGPDWLTGAYWIGGKKVGNTWMWDGLVSGEISYNWWGANQPDGNGICLNLIHDSNKFDDASCGDSIKFFCEKPV